MHDAGQRQGRSTNAARARAAHLLRSPESGLIGQGARFALSGGTVALVYLATTTLLAEACGVPFQVALAVGFCTGLTVHFTLQRTFVWVHREDFALALRHQIGRYLVVATVQYGVTAASTGLLPGALGVPTEAVYLATVAIVVSSNFLVFRNGIFHARRGDSGAPQLIVDAAPAPRSSTGGS